MSGFRKAKAEQAALKIALYGPPGSGKTMTSLLLAEGLAALDGKRVAYFDTEHGTDFYCQAVPSRAVHPEAFDFDALYTRSIMEVLSEVKQLNHAQYSVVVLDSITHLWEAARAAYAGKQTRAGTIPMHAWGVIKKPYKDILSILLSSPMHVIICGRQGTEYATDDETDELKAIGFKMKAEGETAYEPHILIRMESIKPKNTNTLATIIAYAEKDRTGVLSGRSFVGPTFQTICAPLLGLLGRNQAQIKPSDQVASDDAEAIEQAERALATQSEELMRTFSARIELADSVAVLKKIGDGITPALKAKMLPADLASVREKYQRRMATMSPKTGDPSTYWHREKEAPSAGNGDLPHNAETGEVMSAEGMGAVAQHMTAIASEAIAQPLAVADDSKANGLDVPAPNPRLDALLAEGRAAATNGAKAFMTWRGRLNAPDDMLFAPHAEALRKAAVAADERG